MQLEFPSTTNPPSPRSGDLLRSFVHDPPRTSGELLSRLEGVDRCVLAEELFDALRDGIVDAGRHGWVAEVLLELGVASHWDSLAELLAASGVDARTRAMLQTILLQVDFERATQLTEALDPSVFGELLVGSTAAVFDAIELGSADSSALADLLEELPPEGRGLMLDQLEQLRAQTELPAAVAWEGVLRRRGLGALHPRAIEAVVADGGTEAEELLDKLRARAGGKKARRRYEKALMTLRTRDIGARPTAAPSAGRCWVSPCDGQGAFVACMTSKGRGGRLRISDIVVRTAGAARDGFVIPEAGEADLRELLEDIRTRFRMEAAPLPEVAALVMAAVRRGKVGGVSLGKDTRLGLRAFEKAHRKTRADLAPVPATPAATATQYQELLARPEFAAWFLDSGDLAGQGIEAPHRDFGADEEWLEHAASRLQDSPVQERLLAMTDYQSRWFQWASEEEPALLCAAAHAELQGDLGSSAFLRALLKVSAALLDDDYDELDVSRLGNPAARADLRARFFSGVVSATGRDLAELDFTEAADIVLERAVKALPGESRPTADVQRTLAHQLGRAYADQAIGDVMNAPTKEGEQFVDVAAALLVGQLDLDEDTAEEIAEEIEEDLEEFEAEFCDDCTIGCLQRSRADHTRLFHSSDYPPHIGDC